MSLCSHPDCPDGIIPQLGDPPCDVCQTSSTAELRRKIHAQVARQPPETVKVVVMQLHDVLDILDRLDELECEERKA